MTLPVEEFLRRFLLHLLPRAFVRIRDFGFLANRRRAMLLPLCLRSSARYRGSVQVPTLGCSLVYVTGAAEGLYELEPRCTLRPYSSGQRRTSYR